jgi:hypothetical protein
MDNKTIQRKILELLFKFRLENNELYQIVL